MLKLKKVEMLGFKSFCDRTSLNFNGGGIAAIVGPNGCGKSNISDAINWVLGEQSAKSLRGERMADVIFNGTRERKPTGLAEVTLSLVDPDYHEEREQVSPISSNGNKGKAKEVVISRRLFRSGESEYLLNGQPCRLRDIQEIFMGTGLGPNSYAIIEQGRIGQILSSKPYDRRALIEEAAGVTKFKTKRRLAEAKLEASRQNLSRVNDILEEIGRQVNSLKRQASKARRYGEMREELRGLLRVIYGGKQSEMAAQVEQAGLELNAAAEKLKTMVAQVEALEQEQFDLSHAGFEKEDLLRQRREIVTGLALEIDRARNRITYQEQQIVEIQARLKEYAAQAEQARARVAALEGERAAGQEGAKAAEAQLEDARGATARLQEDLAAAETAFTANQAELEAARSLLIVMLGEVSELKNQLAQVEEYLAGLARQKERAEQERQSAAHEEGLLRRRRGELLEQMSRRQMELESVAAKKASLEQRLAQLSQENTATQAQLENLRTQHVEVRARRDSLEQILSHRAYTAEAVKRLFQASEGAKKENGSFRPMGILADYLEVDRPFEHQVEDFLKEELEYVVVQSWSAADEGLQLLRTEAEGRATFLVHPPKDAAIPRKDSSSVKLGDLPAKYSSQVKGCLLDHIRLNNGLGAGTVALLPRLKNCFLVESSEAGKHLAMAHPEQYFLTPEGECFHGYTVTGGKRTNAGPLALKRELRELIPRAAQLNSEIEASAKQLRRLEEETDRATKALENLRSSQVEQEKLAAGSDEELKQLSHQLLRTGERLSVAALEIERMEHERGRAVEQSERLRGDLGARAQRREEVESKIAGLTSEAGELSHRRAETAQSLSEAQARTAGLEERNKAAATALERVELMLNSARAAAGEIDRQGVNGAAEMDRLRADNVEAAARAEQAEKERAAAEQAAVVLQAELEAGRARMSALEEEIRAARVELDQVREQKSAIEVNLARLESDGRHLEETCHSDLGVAIGELESDPSAAILDGAVLFEAEEQSRQLREKIEGLGPVNMMALEEYQESAQRQEFLLAQQTDLVDSIRDTAQAIQEIDAVTQKQFQEAFEAINANFQETFRILFGGGFGAMRLSEEEGAPGVIRDAGIDLVVQPPGKRLQNVLLLSGGEKALTALALLLAVFRYQPSPFCILDEVDAPLDETNIGRFTEMVEKMSLRTQFIIITHSKKTMEVAPVLYGVTMEEPGVSRLVSVRFQERELAQIA